MQLICDQGSPYMSETTREAIETLECEHAPQKEGTPTEKAPKERAFRTVKDALKPLSELTAKIAKRVPAPRSGCFARALGRILLSSFLRVYEAAPRQGVHPLDGRCPTELEAIAQEQRERARADTRSVRLALAEIHREYHLPGCAESFVRAHRHHALEDIQEAERRLRRKACRCAVKACDRYFAGILRNVREENRERRRQERQRRIHLAQQQRELQKMHQERERQSLLLREQPELALEEGLDMVNAQWSERDGALLAAGRGLGTHRIAQALESLSSTNAHLARDRAEAVWRAWVSARPLAAQRLAAVRAAFHAKLSRYLVPAPSLAALSRAAIRLRPRSSTRPPIRAPDLRNYEAGSWG
jgi:hypothetical protein